MIYIIVSIAIAIAAGIFAGVYARPSKFFLVMLVSAILLSGIVLHGISYLDELFVGAACIAVVLRKSEAGIPSWKDFNPFRKNPHLALFLITCAYMSLQSLRGIIVTASFQKVRWVLSFLVLAVLATLIAKGKVLLPRWRRTAFIITLAGLVYFSAYVLMGMTYELTHPDDAALHVRSAHGRYDTQNVYWGGSTYASFLLVLVVPAALLLVRDKQRRNRWLAWVTLFIVTFQGFYWDSRATWVSLLIFIALSPPIIGLKRSTCFAAIYAAVFALFHYFIWPGGYSIGLFAKILYDPLRTVAETPANDWSNFSRFAQTQIGFQIVRSNPVIFFIGTGWRVDYLIPGALVKYYQEHGYGQEAWRVGNDATTVGLTALLVETGVIGLLLYLANFVMAAKSIIQRERTAFKYTLLASLALAGLWSGLTNHIDIVVFQMMLMPMGLLFLLSSANTEESGGARPQVLLTTSTDATAAAAPGSDGAAEPLGATSPYSRG